MNVPREGDILRIETINFHHIGKITEITDSSIKVLIDSLEIPQDTVLGTWPCKYYSEEEKYNFPIDFSPNYKFTKNKLNQ